MLSEVKTFAVSLLDVETPMLRLELIRLRVLTMQQNYLCAVKEKKPECREFLQQLYDLYAHIYYKKPLLEFGNIVPLASSSLSGYTG